MAKLLQNKKSVFDVYRFCSPKGEIVLVEAVPFFEGIKSKNDFRTTILRQKNK